MAVGDTLTDEKHVVSDADNNAAEECGNEEAVFRPWGCFQHLTVLCDRVAKSWVDCEC